MTNILCETLVHELIMPESVEIHTFSKLNITENLGIHSRKVKHTHTHTQGQMLTFNLKVSNNYTDLVYNILNQLKDKTYTDEL